MVFSSPTFLFLFLPAVLIAVWLSPARGRNLLLVLASAGFYVWGAQEFLLVVVLSTLADFFLSRSIESAREGGDDRRARLLLIAAIVQNLALLAWFKYASFGVDQLNRALGELGIETVGTLSIVLPIGISFFTFGKLSYVVDVFRGEVRAVRSPVDLLLFVLLFPQAIAGPIVRLREIETQLTDRPLREDMLARGAVRFSHGLAKKVLIADTIAPVADMAFASAEAGTLTTTAAWIGLLAYTMQLYYDFSGYCDMAIGIGMMLGFNLPENFDRPYTAKSITEFWRRWHMTLSRWFRDYVYIPLGGNRGSEGRIARNLVIVFLLTGFWHGAAWAFVLWGAYHGAWLLAERRFGLRTVEGDVALPWLRQGAMFLIVMLGWVLFRAEDLGLAIDYYTVMFTPNGLALPGEMRALLGGPAGPVLVGAALVALVPSALSGGRWLVEAAGTLPRLSRTATLAAILPLGLLWTLTSDFSPFLYFRF